jgi:DNA invertase Pin-like site-specific DNA recombinase
MSKQNSKSNGNGKPLRFACFVRVSTEQQEKWGESLRVQRNANARDVERLGGRIVERYGGQEHGTAGWERAELDRLLADAARSKFDAVIVAYADRWSPDNAKSKAGLEVFRRHGVRFFVGSTEMDLHLLEHRLMLGINAEIGEFIARQQAKKSLETRLERARKGIPTAGKIPFGRTYDRDAGTWRIDPVAKRQIEEIADRIMGGTSLNDLAREYELNHSNLSRTLRLHSGEEWSYTLGGEVFTCRVPRLLPERTIRTVREVLKALEGQPHVRPHLAAQAEPAISFVGLHLLRGLRDQAERPDQPGPSRASDPLLPPRPRVRGQALPREASPPRPGQRHREGGACRPVRDGRQPRRHRAGRQERDPRDRQGPEGPGPAVL